MKTPNNLANFTAADVTLCRVKSSDSFDEWPMKMSRVTKEVGESFGKTDDIRRSIRYLAISTFVSQPSTSHESGGNIYEQVVA